MDKNKLYQHDPEEQEWDVDQSLFDHTPVKQGETQAKDLYQHNQENLTAENYDDLYNNTQNVRNTKSRAVMKKTNNFLTISTILIGSAVGVIAIVNPLTSRPKISDGVYSFSENTLHYKFEVSNFLSNYECKLVLMCDETEIFSELLEQASNEGEYIVSIKGNYDLKFTVTNKVDYKNTVSLYTFTY